MSQEASVLLGGHTVDLSGQPPTDEGPVIALLRRFVRIYEGVERQPIWDEYYADVVRFLATGHTKVTK